MIIFGTLRRLACCALLAALALTGCRRETSGQTAILLTLTTAGPIDCITISEAMTSGDAGMGAIAQSLDLTTGLPPAFTTNAGWRTAQLSALVYSGGSLGDGLFFMVAEGHRGSCAGPVVARFTGSATFTSGQVLPAAGKLALLVVDADGDGWPANEDCNDNDATIYPGAPELCDGKDHSCSGVPDMGCACPAGTQRPCYPTALGLADPHYNVGTCVGGVQACGSNGKWAATCVGAVLPAPEQCDGKDHDCNGTPLGCGDSSCAGQLCDGNGGVCTNSVCVPACSEVPADCTDTHCQGKRCAGNGVCSGGQCVVEICNNGVDDNGDGLVDCQDALACPAPGGLVTPMCCNLVWTDSASDVHNCGACATDCTTGHTVSCGSIACVHGACVYGSAPNRSTCTISGGGPGVCCGGNCVQDVELSCTDGIDNNCNGKTDCQEGAAICPPPGNFTTPSCCGTTPPRWVDLSSDITNCKTCGKTCTPAPNDACHAAVCTGGTCGTVTVCTAGGCDGVACKDASNNSGECTNGVCCAGCAASDKTCQTGTGAGGLHNCGEGGVACVDCSPSPSDCIVDACTASGTCTHTVRSGSCSNGTGMCTSTGVCCTGCIDSSGTCHATPDGGNCGAAGGSCTSCNDSNACTTDTCSAAGKCVNTPATGASCTAGANAGKCTSAGVCCAGCIDNTGACQTSSSPTCGIGGAACTSCDDGNSCTADACNASGTCTHTTMTGSTCTTGGNAGKCTSGAVCCAGCIDGTGACQTNSSPTCGISGASCKSCDDGNSCTTDACTSAGVCTNTVTAGASCTTSGNAGKCSSLGVCCAGCIDVSNACQTGNSTGACGTTGASCAICSTPTDPCMVATCDGTSCSTTAGNDGATCTLGDGGTGTCGSGTCQPTPCGGPCPTGETCTSNVCVCNSTSCTAAGGCCATVSNTCVMPSYEHCQLCANQIFCSNGGANPNDTGKCIATGTCATNCGGTELVQCGGFECLVKNASGDGPSGNLNSCSSSATGTGAHACDPTGFTVPTGQTETCGCTVGTPGTCAGPANTVCRTANGTRPAECYPCQVGGPGSTNGQPCKGGLTCDTTTGTCH